VGADAARLAGGSAAGGWGRGDLEASSLATAWQRRAHGATRRARGAVTRMWLMPQLKGSFLISHVPCEFIII